jgi:hypothetical protein
MISVAAVVRATGICLFLACWTSPGAGQTRWKWPDKASNLKVLPSDTPPTKLRPIMLGFTDALGVSCSHCHVGEDGKPLQTYDFASDANPKKDIARGMLRMLGSINDQLHAIQPNKQDRVNMWCHTCHRGRPEPRQLAEELSLVYAKSGADSMIAEYEALRELFYGSGSYDFREPVLNELGYKALGNKDAGGAVTVLQTNARYHPQSGNAFDSLGEAYLAFGDTAQAIANYEKAVRLDPKNENAVKVLSLLKTQRR